MRKHTVIAAAIPTMLVIGCEILPVTSRDSQSTGPSTDRSSIFPTERTATLWVKGLGCPY